MILQKEGEIMIASIQATNTMMGMGAYSVGSSSAVDVRAVVRSVLAKYDANSLSADDAKAIFMSFRQAGIQKDAELRGAVQSIGFNYLQLCQLSRTN
jgi:hypothetical protein